MIDRINVSHKWWLAVIIASIISTGFVSFVFISPTHATTPADERKLNELYDNAPNPNSKVDYSKNYTPSTQSQYGMTPEAAGVQPLTMNKNRSYIIGIVIIISVTILVVGTLIYRKQIHRIKKN
jgi:hypothetical protein